MTKPAVGKTLPKMSFEKLGGGQITIGEPRDKHLLFVIYRGKHCGRCKRYLNGLEERLSQWTEAGIDVVAVSADVEAKARADVDEFGWSFDIGYGMTEAQMRALGLYVSDPLSPDEADARFAEPGVFCVMPNGVLHIACLSNGPAARPDLDELLDGMKFNIANDRPTRGTVV